MATGKLIVFEGFEGTGKSTQLALVRERLERQGTAVLSLREPGGTPVGDAIRGVLLDPSRAIAPAAEALLFMASRAELCLHQIRPALARGVVVLLDRFFLSTYAYQIVGRGLPEEDVRAANHLATGGVVPDLTVLLDLPVAEGLKRAAERGASDRIERAADDFHARVVSAFRNFAETAWMSAHPEAGPIVRVDANGGRDAVAQRVADVLAQRIGGPFAQELAAAPATR